MGPGLVLPLSCRKDVMGLRATSSFVLALSLLGFASPVIASELCDLSDYDALGHTMQGKTGFFDSAFDASNHIVHQPARGGGRDFAPVQQVSFRETQPFEQHVLP